MSRSPSGGGLAVIEGGAGQGEVRNAEAIRARGEPQLEDAVVDQAPDEGGRDRRDGPGRRVPPGLPRRPPGPGSAPA
jgi:hypothetical protein